MSDLAVAIVTYKRPRQLEAAIRAAVDQIAALPLRTRLIVVDNDPHGSAREVVERVVSSSIQYVLEVQPGIPAARNAALNAASDCRLLAFIDDDELPNENWLTSLVASWEEWQCDAVAGPTVRLLDGSEDEWVAASGFFAPTRRPHGTVLPGAPTGNLLLDLTTVRRLGLRFDDRFRTTGGSDTLFTRQLVAHGGIIRWCADAVTVEPTPADRATREWVLARDRRTGNSWSRVHLALADAMHKRLATAGWLLLLASKLILLGSLRRLAGLVGDDIGQRARGEREHARARGLLSGLVGRRVEEYKRP